MNMHFLSYKNPKSAAFTLLEMLGALGVLALLVGLSASTISNYLGGAKMEGSSHIARTLNDAVAKFNQSMPASELDTSDSLVGSTMTALVPRYIVSGSPLIAGLPEYDVLYRLTRGYQPSGGKVGPFFNPYLRPVFNAPAEDPYRAVWINGVTDKDPGRFVLIGGGKPLPVKADGSAYENLSADAIGIVGFEPSNQAYDAPTESVEPMLVLSGRPGRDAVYAGFIASSSPASQRSLALSSSSGGVASSGIVDGAVAFVATPTSSNWEFAYWTGDLAGYPAMGAIKPTRDLQAGAIFRPISVDIQVVASPANAGQTKGSGTYNMGDALNIEAFARDGWTFLGWSSGPVHTNHIYSAASTVIAQGNHKFIAQFVPSDLVQGAVLVRSEPTNEDSGVPAQTAPTIPPSAPTADSGTPYYGFNWATGEPEAPGTAVLSGPADLRLNQLTPFTLTSEDTGGALRVNGSLLISLSPGVSMVALPTTVVGSKGTVLVRSVGTPQYASWAGTMQPYERFEVPLALRGKPAGSYVLTSAVSSTGGFHSSTMTVNVWGSSVNWGSASWGSGWWGSNAWGSQWGSAGSGGAAWGSGWLTFP